jgi:hypothetical protein
MHEFEVMPLCFISVKLILIYALMLYTSLVDTNFIFYKLHVSDSCVPGTYTFLF